MIRTLEIKNFKSIKHLQQPCRRINIFVGEPNAGKSNILEAFGLFSFGYYSRYGKSLADFVRYGKISHLFYDEDLTQKIQMVFGDIALEIEFKDARFQGVWLELKDNQRNRIGLLHGDYASFKPQEVSDRLIPFKFYKFAAGQSFERPESDFLLPPSGENLVSLMLTHEELRSNINHIFAPFGLKLSLRPRQGEIEVIKELGNVVVSYPYSLISDTLRRTIFHFTALLSNADSILAFEEPESHAFPYYTKYLAETIALDKRGNQFFVSTHSPYFLLPLLEKARKGDIAIFVTYLEDYQTKARLLSDEEMEEIMEIDLFSNLDRFREGR